MMTPPLSICAAPRLTVSVPVRSTVLDSSEAPRLPHPSTRCGERYLPGQPPAPGGATPGIGICVGTAYEGRVFVGGGVGEAPGAPGAGEGETPNGPGVGGAGVGFGDGFGVGVGGFVTRGSGKPGSVGTATTCS